MAAWSFAWALRREEVIAALEPRLDQIEASSRAVSYAIGDIPNTDTPATVAEHYRLGQARLDREAAWARQLLERVRAGEYWFDGEPGPPWSARPATGARTIHGAPS